MAFVADRTVAVSSAEPDVDLREPSHAERAALFPGIPASRIAFALVTCDGRASVAFGREAFDSELFDLEIGRILAARASSAAEYRLLFTAVTSMARSSGYDHVLHRTPATNLPEIWALERTGFELMDVGLTFAQRVGPGTARVRDYPDLQVGHATDADVETIARIMPQEGWGSRFEADPAYSAARVRELRTRWLINSYRGRAQAFFVGSFAGQPAGYATCLLDKDHSGEIELVGTLPAFRGRGVASRVLEHALVWFSERTKLVTVRTQATNTAAAVLYERAGFTLRSSDLTFRAALTPHSRGCA